jgi:subtilisin family serine protease
MVRLVVAALVVALGAVAAPSANARSLAAGHESESYVVTVSKGSAPRVVARGVGAATTFVYKSALNGFAARLTTTQVEQLRHDPRVESVDVDRLFELLAGEIPPGEFEQFTSYGQDRIGLLDSRTADVDNVDERVDADIAIFDTGIAPHPDLPIAGGVDCTGDQVGTVDREGHGTQVAGFAGALDNAFGAVGVAPGARLWAVKVSKKGIVITSDLLCGLEWARDHAATIDVANLSLSGKGTDTGQCGIKRKGVNADPLHQAICSVVDAGVVVVVAAGNDADLASEQVPAAYPEVITVSAFTESDGLPGGLGPAAGCLPGERDDFLASFSNFGAAVDIAAPGVCVAQRALDGTYQRVNGTSFAAPHVAGAAALVKARHPAYTPAQVRQALLDAAEHAPLGGDPDGIAEPILNVGRL